MFAFLEFILPDDKKEKKTKENNESSANLLLWAIFVNRKELAEICWLRGTNQLCKSYMFKVKYLNHRFCTRESFFKEKSKPVR